jgi:hypothetical protein
MMQVRKKKKEGFWSQVAKIAMKKLKRNGNFWLTNTHALPSDFRIRLSQAFA